MSRHGGPAFVKMGHYRAVQYGAYDVSIFDDDKVPTVEEMHCKDFDDAQAWMARTLYAESGHPPLEA